MKTTRIIALALALVTASALVACNNSAADETTTAATTTTVAPVTTKKPAAPETKPTTEGPVAETPETDPVEIAKLIGYGNLTSTVTDVALAGLNAFGDNEGVDKLFDGNTVSTKLGGNSMADTGAEITWKTNVETTVEAYVLFTGNDSSQWKRTPLAWTLSGSTDGENWTVIDEVVDSTMQDLDAAPYGFTVDTPAAYTNYKLVITKTTTAGQLQFNELILIGKGATPAAETPVTDAAELEALLGSGTNLSSTVVDPTYGAPVVWGDGAAANAFDGDTTSTKLGGGDIVDGVEIAWTTNVATTIKNYIIYTGGDSGSYGRVPMGWVLFASNDGESWKAIDVVSNSGMVNSDSTPYGFAVDAPGSYTYYKLVVTNATNGDGNWVASGEKFALQFNELVLIGDAAAAE